MVDIGEELIGGEVVMFYEDTWNYTALADFNNGAAYGVQTYKKNYGEPSEWTLVNDTYAETLSEATYEYMLHLDLYYEVTLEQAQAVTS